MAKDGFVACFDITPWAIDVVVACGKQKPNITGATYELHRVTCPDCLESEIYKEAMLQFEIGFDGELSLWILHLRTYGLLNG